VSEAKFGEPIAYAPKRGLRTAEDMFIGDAWPAYRSRLVACYNAFAGVDDPVAELARLRKIKAAAVAWRAEINSANESARIYKALLKLLSVLPEE